MGSVFQWLEDGMDGPDMEADSPVPTPQMVGGETGPGDVPYPRSQSLSEAGLRPGLGFWRPASHLSMEDSGTGINSKCQRFFLEPITPAQYQDIECADWPLGTDTAHPLQLLTWFLALGSSYRKVECLAKKPMCLLLPPLREAWPLTPKNRTEQLP